MIGLTLGRYLSGRFFRMIMAVFVTIFSLLYVVDFVELLRRTTDNASVTTSSIAFLTLLRTPSTTEQILPFCVLFGTMAVFLNLTRKLELLVARAAGVSVWQFLGPPILISTLIGIASVVLLNPVSAHMKQRADKIETAIFGRQGAGGRDVIWVRQTGVDGESIIRADDARNNNNTLIGVTAYTYDPEGRFSQRIKAQKAELGDGVWRLDDAEVSEPGEEPRSFKTFLLATTLEPGEVTTSSMSAESVPFWELPALRRETESAGPRCQRISPPVSVAFGAAALLVAMTLIAAAFSLRFFRFGGIAKFVGGGVAAGFVLYVATKFVGDLGGSGVLSPPVAAWSPAVVASMLGALALLNQEDG